MDKDEIVVAFHPLAEFEALERYTLQWYAKLWLPTLKEAGFKASLSGHTHADRLDGPAHDMPVLQFVGGGPKPEQAT